jgi:hypothetical protein
MQNSHHAIVDSSTKFGRQETFISLDNASHPGRPGLDELVPSRYALKVGEIDVMVISDGVLPHHVQRPLEHVRRKELVLQPGRPDSRVDVAALRPPLGTTHTHRRWARDGPGLGIAAGREAGPASAGRGHRSSIRD